MRVRGGALAFAAHGRYDGWPCAGGLAVREGAVGRAGARTTNRDICAVGAARAMRMVFVAGLVLAVLLWCGGVRAAEAPRPDPLQGDGRVSGFYAWEGTIPATPGRLLRQERLETTLGLAHAGAQVRMLYSSTDGIDGHSAVAVSGLFFMPKGEPPEGGWPLLAWAHETTGMADVCAPSWSGYSLAVETFLNTWLARGFAVVATDYQGLGTPGAHPYMAVRPGAYGVLDSIRAVQGAFPGVGRKVLLVGYSQGAGAVFEAAAVQRSYAAELDIRGTIATGIPFSAEETAAARRAIGGLTASNLVYPLLIGLVAQQVDPSLRAADMFAEPALGLFELNRRGCVWQLVLEVLAARVTRGEGVRPGYAKALDAIAPLLAYSSMRLPQPLFVGIGAEDRDAPARLQLALVKQSCEAGTTVEAHLYAGMSHFAAVNRSVADAIRFADRVLGGEAVSPVCDPTAE